MKQPLLFSLLVLLACGIGCQPSADRPIEDPDEVVDGALLRQDLDYLRDAVVRRHPRFHDQ